MRPMARTAAPRSNPPLRVGAATLREGMETLREEEERETEEEEWLGLWKVWLEGEVKVREELEERLGVLTERLEELAERLGLLTERLGELTERLEPPPRETARWARAGGRQRAKAVIARIIAFEVFMVLLLSIGIVIRFLFRLQNYIKKPGKFPRQKHIFPEG